jgi:FAD/FMN-containing dehydrogenase
MNEQTQRYNEMHLPALRAKFQCQVLAGGDSEYDAARRVWNGMIDRKPAMVVRATGIADVMQAVRIARDQMLAVCVRGGGHSVAGKSVANDDD